MYVIMYTNFGYGPTEKFETIEAALAYGKIRCFEFGIYDASGKGLVAAWSPIGGTKFYAISKNNS